MSMLRGGMIGAIGGGGNSSSTQLSLSDGLACYTSSFSGVTTTSFSHSLGTEDLLVEFRDNDGNLIVPLNWQITSPNTIDVEFSMSQQGHIVVVGCIESGLAPITGGVTTIEGLSGVIDVDSPNGGILISTSGQILQLNALFTPASGALLEQTRADIDTLSGLIGSGGGGAASGTACAALDFTPASGTQFVLEHGLQSEDFVFQVWDVTTSTRDPIVPNTVTPSGANHVSVEIDSPTSGKLVILTCGGSNSSSTISGGGNPVDARQASGSIIPDTSGLYILGTDPLPWSGIYVDKVDAGSGCFNNRPTVGGIEVALVTDTLTETFGSGVENLNGLQGDVALVSNNGTVSIQTLAPDEIDFSFNQIVSGIIETDSFVGDFTTASGTSFVLQHDLAVENFTFNLWDTTTDPIQVIEAVNVAPSGFNHVFIELASPMEGKIVLTNGGSDSGLIPVDKRLTIGNIQPVTSGTLNIGTETLPFGGVEADSIKKRTEEVALEIHTPVGMITPYAGTTAPRGWLICDGSGVSRSQYSELFSTIGTAFGAGDGSTTFNIPDLRARTPIGLNNNALPNSGVSDSDRTFKTIGDSGGAETHVLTDNEMPTHGHTQRTGNTQGIGSGPAPDTYGTSITNTSIATANAGNDEAHNNLQPYLAVNYIIRF